MLTLKIDGRTVEAPAGATLLSVATEAGIEIPAICHHSSLEPYGACRLCLVEVTHPSWKGKTKLVTSCSYLVEEGLEVMTATPTIVYYRKVLLGMLLAQCPGSKTVVELHRRFGGPVELEYSAKPDAVDCILCGLCVRVCEEHSTSAIAHRHRSVLRDIALPESEHHGCVGCGACALVCPTGFIKFVREEGRWEVWGHDFDLPVATVHVERCHSCGRCEEVCPVQVPRIVLTASGDSYSYISPAFCQGCGLCVAACPSDAIWQEPYPAQELMARIRTLAEREPHVVAFVCPRSPFPPGMRDKVIELPCIGRVTLPMILAALAAGARRVLLIGRDQETCFFDNGEDVARLTADLAGRMAHMMGFGAGRVEVRVPERGRTGPLDLLKEELQRKNEPNPYADELPPAVEADNYDEVAVMLRALCERGITPDIADWKAVLPTTQGADTLIFVNRLLILDHLAYALADAFVLRGQVHRALNALKRLGIDADVLSGSAGCTGSAEAFQRDAEAIKARGAKRVLCLCPESAAGLKEHLPGVEVEPLRDFMVQRAQQVEAPAEHLRVAAPAGMKLPELPGVEWVESEELPPHPEGTFSFSLSGEMCKLLKARGEITDRLGASHFLCDCPADYLRSVLFLRQGAWCTSLAQPITLLELACRANGGAGNG